MAKEITWFVTAANPRTPDKIDGWKVHAVMADWQESLGSVRFVPAACGLCALHGWTLDLFITEETPSCLCKRCVAALAKAKADNKEHFPEREKE